MLGEFLPSAADVQRFLTAYWTAWQGLTAHAEAQLLRQHHLDLRAFVALSWIQAGVSSPSELSGHLGVPRYVVTRTLDALSTLGAVTRTTDPHDTRRQQVHVTAHGQQLWQDAFLTAQAVCAGPLAQLGPDLAQLTQQLERLAQMLHPSALHAAPQFPPVPEADHD